MRRGDKSLLQNPLKVAQSLAIRIKRYNYISTYIN